MEVSGFDKRTSLFDAGVHYSGEKVYSTASDIKFFSLVHNGRQDTQHNDIQHNDIQHNYIQYNYIQHNDIQHNDIQHNDIQHNDIQHNNK